MGASSPAARTSTSTCLRQNPYTPVRNRARPVSAPSTDRVGYDEQDLRLALTSDLLADEVIERAKLAVDLGVDAIVVTTPYGKDMTQDAIVEHYRRIREAIGVGIFLYNEEAVSGNRIELDTLLRICELPGIVGIKESSGDAAYTTAMTAAGTGIPVFEGWENLLGSVRGIAGFIGPLVNLEPALCNAMLVDPTPDRQAEVNEACERFGLFTDDWYRPLKAELVRRGVIETDLVVPESAVVS